MFDGGDDRTTAAVVAVADDPVVCGRVKTTATVSCATATGHVTPPPAKTCHASGTCNPNTAECRRPPNQDFDPLETQIGENWTTKYKQKMHTLDKSRELKKTDHNCITMYECKTQCEWDLGVLKCKAAQDPSALVIVIEWEEIGDCPPDAVPPDEDPPGEIEEP